MGAVEVGLRLLDIAVPLLFNKAEHVFAIVTVAFLLLVLQKSAICGPYASGYERECRQDIWRTSKFLSATPCCEREDRFRLHDQRFF